MAQYVVETNAEQEAAITAVTESANAVRASDEQPLTNADHVAARLQQVLDSYVREAQAMEENRVLQVWRSLEPKEKQAQREQFADRLETLQP